MNPADVLATLDRCASRHDCAGDYGHAEELREARAAVARLIAAAQGVLADVDAPGHTIRNVRGESVAALRAALAGGAR